MAYSLRRWLIKWAVITVFTLLFYGAIVLCYKRTGVVAANWATVTEARNEAYANPHTKPKH